ncbi:hypothetical protein TcCL_NonESM10549 [Trypanosoma cruzi]|nr:hypothetical protein TcCL_NonESM10549 [Trypanosoma cruzi]
MLHGVWRYCSEMPHHHARGRGTEWNFFFLSAVVGVGAAASDLSARWPQCVAVALLSREICYDAFTGVLFRGKYAGGCAIAEWRERSGGKCVSAAVKSRAGCLAAEGTAHPTQHRSCRASNITLQDRSRRHQHAARQRMPPPPRVRPEGGTSAVTFRGVTPCGTVACPKPSSRSPHTTPGTGRGVFASWRTLRWSFSSLQVDGRLILLFFPPRRMAAR